MQRISADDFCGGPFPAAIQKTHPAAGKGKTAVCPIRKTCASKCQWRSAHFYAKEHIFSENIKAFPMKF